MDIERISMDMAQSRAMGAVETQVLSMSLEQLESTGNGLLDMMNDSMTETAVDPNRGVNLDLRI